jgi:hypothetical protein
MDRKQTSTRPKRLWVSEEELLYKPTTLSDYLNDHEGFLSDCELRFAATQREALMAFVWPPNAPPTLATWQDLVHGIEEAHERRGRILPNLRTKGTPRRYDGRNAEPLTVEQFLSARGHRVKREQQRAFYERVAWPTPPVRGAWLQIENMADVALFYATYGAACRPERRKGRRT